MGHRSCEDKKVARPPFGFLLPYGNLCSIYKNATKKNSYNLYSNIFIRPKESKDGLCVLPCVGFFQGRVGYTTPWFIYVGLDDGPIPALHSASQMEFDLGLEIQLHRVDLVVTCELSCIFKNEYLTKAGIQPFTCHPTPKLRRFRVDISTRRK